MNMLVPSVQSRAFPIHYMDPGSSGIKSRRKHPRNPRRFPCFPIAIPRRVRSLSAAGFLRFFLLLFLAATLFRLRLCPLAGLFYARLDLGFREFWRAHLENRPLDAARGQLTDR